MSAYLRISVTFLDPRFHGRGDRGRPEWPPSPLRLFQAMVAANADRLDDIATVRGLEWLERQTPPIILAPDFEIGSPFRLSVPNNSMDLVGTAWSKGNYFGTGDSNPATHRTMKTVRPVKMQDGETLFYLWPMGDESEIDSVAVNALIDAANRMVALGWGIDLVVGQGARIEASQLNSLPGECWKPTLPTTNSVQRVLVSGTLRELRRRHDTFLNRVGEDGFIPPDPLSAFELSGYRRMTDPVQQPYAILELGCDDGRLYPYSQRKLIHIAGMVRHLAIEAMKKSPPADVPDDWVESFVAGHANNSDGPHQQFSYLPLPSIGHHYSDQAVRRVMITAPIGCDAWLNHLVTRIQGLQLIPKGNEFGKSSPPALVRVSHDPVANQYLKPANQWDSVTPVILPGHDDHKPRKTESLIRKALSTAGIEPDCEFTWSAHSRFRKSFSAHKYDRRKQPSGYLRPDHLPTQTSVHLSIKFPEGVKMPGPIAIGAGRHCGFGLMGARPG